jgi:hypothetical protein
MIYVEKRSGKGGSSYPEVIGLAPRERIEESGRP